MLTLLVVVSTRVDLANALASSKGFGATPNVKPYTSCEEQKIPAIQSLLQTLRSNPRTDIQNVEVGDSPVHGRGLFATKNFQPGQIVCKIPSEYGIALGDPQSQTIAAVSSTPADCGANLIPFLDNQLWSFYANTLPQAVQDYSATPDQWTEDDVNLLEYEEVIRCAAERKQNIANVAENKGLSLSQLQYATWIVTSRSFSIAMAEDQDVQYDGKGQVMAKAGARPQLRILVPFLDMVNHHNVPNCRLTLIDPEKDDAWFALEATRKINKHSELFLSYGPGMSSVSLLCDYGFVPSKTSDIDKLMLKKKGDKIEWTTTLEDDQAHLKKSQHQEGTERLQRILNFRLRLKEAEQAL